MALKLNERYPGRFDNPSAGYPQGSFKNRTTPTAKDGSYLEKDWANDKEGFFQSLLSMAAITANGSVDAVGASQYAGALMKLVTLSDFANATGTANAIAASYLPAVTSLADGMMLRFLAIASPNTGAVTFAPNGMAAAAIYGIDGNPLSGGEIAAGAICTVVYSAAASRWVLISSTLGELQVPPATKASHSVNLGQLLSTVSPLQIATAAATLASHAVNLGQFAFVAAVNGYVKIPTSANPIIIQWGQAASANLVTSSAVFPIAFPTACLNVIAGGANANANTQAYAVVNNTSKTGFSWNAFIANGGTAPSLASAGTVNAWYIAVGT